MVILLAACSSFNQPINSNNRFSDREQIVEIVNKLFVYTDEQNWNALQTEVFTNEVLFDMVSVGAESVETKTAEEITQMWDAGFEGLDAVHHQAGNYIVDIDDDTADVKAYAVASHYKKAATEGNIREFIGSYDIGLVRNSQGWRINEFKYNLKYLDGNLELK
ncbi:MAG: nuclear transport factor 2 family protein [Gammaproteobacteria bacterium]|nr:nuclear transport factor 2 family protein [Gammaproteobacteria bacterium]